MSTAEEWRVLPCFDDKYEVSNQGKVRLTKSKRCLAICNSRGYNKVNLTKKGAKSKQAYIHRLVAELFHPEWNPDLTVDHIDLNKNNNCIYNLQIVSIQFNSSKHKLPSSGYHGVYKRQRDSKWFAFINWTDENGVVRRWESLHDDDKEILAKLRDAKVKELKLDLILNFPGDLELQPDAPVDLNREEEGRARRQESNRRRARKVKADGTIYDNVQAAASALNVGTQTVYARIYKGEYTYLS